jgi:predicted permease
MQTRLRKGLIVLQVAVSLVLLTGAGLLGRTLAHLQSVDAGFDPERVTSARLDLNWTIYDSRARRTAFYRELERDLADLPGVEAVGIGSSFPLNTDPANTVRFTVPEQTVEDGSEPPAVAMMTASPRYFAALGTPLLVGRVFTALDEETTTEPAFIITRSLAEQYWGAASDAVGRRVSLDGGRNWGSVVGVIGDLRLGLEGDFSHLAFAPHNRVSGIEARVLVRGTLNPAATEQALRAAVAGIDPAQPITDVRTLSAYRGERLAPYRLTAVLMAVFAAVALGVTAFGLAGSIAFAVAQRTREIGIRIAVGARPAAILGMLLTETMLLAAAGCAVGAVAAWYGAGYLEQLTPGVARGDPLTFAGTMGVIAVVAVIAALTPARRALLIDPLSVLNRR